MLSNQREAKALIVCAETSGLIFVFVVDAMDSLDERVKQFFANARKMKPEQRDQDFDKIRKVCPRRVLLIAG